MSLNATKEVKTNFFETRSGKQPEFVPLSESIKMPEGIPSKSAVGCIEHILEEGNIHLKKGIVNKKLIYVSAVYTYILQVI